MKKYNLAIIGASGNVGREIIRYLHDRNFPVEKLIAVASNESFGNKISFGDNRIELSSIDELDFSKIDIAFFCAGSKISSKYAIKAAESGCVVIDKSSFYRLKDNIPLIVPEVNKQEINGSNQKIISSPNCCVIPLVVALKPLDDIAKINRVVISTYQSVSGAGKKAMDELYNQTKAKFTFQQIDSDTLPQQIAFNLFPHIDNFREDGSTEEEYKITQELNKILGINSTVTCVRVPVFVSHALSVNIEFSENMNAINARNILSKSDGISVDKGDKYTTPIDSVEKDKIYISRIRDDKTRKNAINMWICSDNLRKGAALNAIQIAEEVIK